ncbi:hypothetical protein JIX56_41830 [Streptomyces sp. CA-210063]|uniref:hypothetical protein n=1 Tax=Streptomyces sp. CA-210063 TaxID=2801029 RepID=UPI00214BD1D3|nr:hypothetical protein [Streptomyces sp. CA-210063]UUU35856.1 hypothetical protein JIX56_41830 [Streptomyces sp. CA-210063]
MTATSVAVPARLNGGLLLTVITSEQAGGLASAGAEVTCAHGAIARRGFVERAQGVRPARHHPRTDTSDRSRVGRADRYDGFT